MQTVGWVNLGNIAGGCAKVHTSKASSMPAVSTCKANPACGESEDSEQNDTLQHSAEAAKQRGNVLYQQAQFPQAISLYSVSIVVLLLC